MTISSTSRKAGPYLGNGTTDEFPFTFKVFTADDVVIVRTATDGVETTLTMGVDYTVSLNADQDAAAGGTVTTTNPPTAGQKITVTSGLANLQPVEVTNGGGFYPRVFNDAFDRLTILVQQLAEQIGRAVKVNISSSTTPDELMDDLGASVAAASSAASASAASAAGSAASASASAGYAADAAASAAALPNTSGGADRALLVDSSGTGWLYKTAAQFLSWLGLGVANAANGVVVLDGTSRLPAASGELLTGIATVTTYMITANGTWDAEAEGVPAHARIIYELWGAGGSGGSRVTTGNVGGGGGGAYVRFEAPGDRAPVVTNITIGAGGTEVSGVNANGNPGGASSISLLLAGGSTVVITAAGGAGGGNAALGVAAVGGAGGAATAGFVSFDGATGGAVSSGNVASAGGSGMGGGGGGALSTSGGGYSLSGGCIPLGTSQLGVNGGYACGSQSGVPGGDGLCRITVIE